MGSGDPPGLQNRRAAALRRRGWVRLPLASANRIAPPGLGVWAAPVTQRFRAGLYGVSPLRGSTARSASLMFSANILPALSNPSPHRRWKESGAVYARLP